MENIKITLVRSLIARKPAQIRTAKTLGLKRPGDSIVLPNDATTKGKINAISHLVSVETV